MSVMQYSEVAKYRYEAPGLTTVSVTHDLIGRHGRIAPVLLHHIEQLKAKGPLRVLDFGAYDRALGRSLERIELPCTYHSLDVDTSFGHEYHGIDEVEGSYDVIGMFELIEHVPYSEVDNLLHRAYQLLTPGGRLFISTPNPNHPTRFFSDVSHIQHWPSHDLFALLRHVGFERTAIEMYGVIYRTPGLMPSIISGIRNLLWRVIGIERRGGILAIAAKSQGG